MMFRVRPYSQIDPRWKDKKLGAGKGEQETIGYIGCLMTCVTAAWYVAKSPQPVVTV